MWSRRNLITVAAAAGLAVPLPTAAQESARPGRRPEVEAMRRFAEATHPRGFEAAADADWRSRWDDLPSRADALTDGGYLVGLHRAFAWFRDGHSTVLPFAFTGGPPEALRAGDFGLDLPFRMRIFDDGLWITAAAPEAGALLGTRLSAMNGVPVAEIILRHAESWSGSDVWAHEWAAAMLCQAAVLRGHGVITGLADAPLNLAVETVDGGALEVSVQPRREAWTRRPIDRSPSEIEQWAEASGGTNYVRLIEGGRTLLVCLDEMADIEGRTFIDLTREAIRMMADPAVQRIVVDLRRNGGGNNNLGEPLRKAIGRSRFNHPGGIYVMIAPATFSAAQNLVTRLERETFAIFVGGPTGGAPNHYGDARTITGETTGMMAMVSTLPWFDSAPQDRRAWIMPDLPVADTFQDWLAGRDPGLATALADTTAGEGNDVTLLRTFPHRRPSQEVVWTPFWRR